MLIEIGRLTQDVEVKTVFVNNMQKHVSNNRLALHVNRDETVFVDVTAWNGTADFLKAYFKKGDELFIEGELRNRIIKYGDKDLNYPYVLITRIKFTHGNKEPADFV